MEFRAFHFSSLRVMLLFLVLKRSAPVNENFAQYLVRNPAWFKKWDYAKLGLKQVQTMLIDSIVNDKWLLHLKYFVFIDHFSWWILTFSWSWNCKIDGGAHTKCHYQWFLDIVLLFWFFYSALIISDFSKWKRFKKNIKRNILKIHN